MFLSAQVSDKSRKYVIGWIKTFTKISCLVVLYYAPQLRSCYLTCLTKIRKDRIFDLPTYSYVRVKCCKFYKFAFYVF